MIWNTKTIVIWHCSRLVFYFIFPWFDFSMQDSRLGSGTPGAYFFCFITFSSIHFITPVLCVLCVNSVFDLFGYLHGCITLLIIQPYFRSYYRSRWLTAFMGQLYMQGHWWLVAHALQDSSVARVSICLLQGFDGWSVIGGLVRRPICWSVHILRGWQVDQARINLKAKWSNLTSFG